ncbi:MAG: Omp28-related outer membrane protein [Alistipes sp.]
MKISRFLLTLIAFVTLASCSDDEPTPLVPSDGKLTIEASPNTIVSDGVDFCEFIVKKGNVQVTEGVQVYMVGETAALPALKFSSKKEGEYKFFASYKSDVTSQIIVKVISSIPKLPADAQPSNTAFRRRVMAFELTGTGCGWCPLMIAGIRQFLTTPDAAKALFVGVHSFNDDHKLFSTTNYEFAKTYGTGTFPSMLFDLRRNFVQAEKDPITTAANIAEAVNEEYQGDAKAGLAAASMKVGSNLVVHVAVKAAVEGEYRVGAWLLEDKLEAEQGNQSGLTADDKFSIHSNVARQVAGRPTKYNFSGDPVGKLTAGQTKTHVLQLPLDAKWKLENCKLVVFVSTPDEVGSNKFYINNAIPCPVDATAAFEYK